MSIKVSGFSSAALDYKIINFDNQQSPTAAIQENVTGTSGRWYSAEVDNKSGSAVYLRMYDGSAPTLGTTAGHWVFYVPATTRTTFEVPGGAPFTTGLNIWTTRNAAAKDTTVPNTSGCIVTVITS